MTTSPKTLSGSIADCDREVDQQLATAGTIDAARQHVAASYGLPSWRRLTQACRMMQAIRNDNAEAVVELLAESPALLTESVRGSDSNWGSPFVFAANLGSLTVMNRLWKLLESSDHAESILQRALNRACLQGQLATADWLLSIGAHIERGMVMGCCETLNADGLAFLLQRNADLCDANGDRQAPIAMILETYCRHPSGKHKCLELAEQHGIRFPETPLMAFHRGRIDQLMEFFDREPDLLHRRFTLRELYPRDVGCHEDVQCGLHGTSLAGATLLHIAIDFDEQQVFDWLLDRGADVSATASVDEAGFGGHTPLFNTVVSQAAACGRQRDAAMARALLDRGADPNHRTTLRKHLVGVGDDKMKEYHDVSPVQYAAAFPDDRWVNAAAVELIRAAQQSNADHNTTD